MSFKFGTKGINSITFVKKVGSTTTTKEVNELYFGSTKVWGRRTFTLTLDSTTRVGGVSVTYVNAAGESVTASKTVASTITITDIGYDQDITVTVTPASTDSTTSYLYTVGFSTEESEQSSVSSSATFTYSSSSANVYSASHAKNYKVTYKYYDTAALAYDIGVAGTSTDYAETEITDIPYGTVPSSDAKYQPDISSKLIGTDYICEFSSSQTTFDSRWTLTNDPNSVEKGIYCDKIAVIEPYRIESFRISLSQKSTNAGKTDLKVYHYAPSAYCYMPTPKQNYLPTWGMSHAKSPKCWWTVDTSTGTCDSHAATPVNTASYTPSTSSQHWSWSNNWLTITDRNLWGQNWQGHYAWLQTTTNYSFSNIRQDSTASNDSVGWVDLTTSTDLSKLDIGTYRKVSDQMNAKWYQYTTLPADAPTSVTLNRFYLDPTLKSPYTDASGNTRYKATIIAKYTTSGERYYELVRILGCGDHTIDGTPAYGVVNVARTKGLVDTGPANGSLQELSSQLTYTATAKYAYDSSGSASKSFDWSPEVELKADPEYATVTHDTTNCKYYSGAREGVRPSGQTAGYGWWKIGTSVNTTFEANDQYGWYDTSVTGNLSTTKKVTGTVPCILSASPDYGYLTFNNVNTTSGWNSGWVPLTTTVPFNCTFTANTGYGYDSSGANKKIVSVTKIPGTYSAPPTYAKITFNWDDSVYFNYPTKTTGFYPLNTAVSVGPFTIKDAYIGNWAWTIYGNTEHYFSWEAEDFTEPKSQHVDVGYVRIKPTIANASINSCWAYATVTTGHNRWEEIPAVDGNYWMGLGWPLYFDVTLSSGYYYEADGSIGTNNKAYITVGATSGSNHNVYLYTAPQSISGLGCLQAPWSPNFTPGYVKLTVSADSTRNASRTGGDNTGVYAIGSFVSVDFTVINTSTSNQYAYNDSGKTTETQTTTMNVPKTITSKPAYARLALSGTNCTWVSSSGSTTYQLDGWYAVGRQVTCRVETSIGYGLAAFTPSTSTPTPGDGVKYKVYTNTVPCAYNIIPGYIRTNFSYDSTTCSYSTSRGNLVTGQYISRDVALTVTYTATGTSTSGYAFDKDGTKTEATTYATPLSPVYSYGDPLYGYITISKLNATCDIASGWYKTASTTTATFSAISGYAFDATPTMTATDSGKAPCTLEAYAEYGQLKISATNCTADTAPGWYKISGSRTVTFTASVSSGASYAYDTKGTRTHIVEHTLPATYISSPQYGYLYVGPCTNCTSNVATGYYSIGTKTITYTANTNYAFNSTGTTTNSISAAVPSIVSDSESQANYYKYIISVLNCTRQSGATTNTYYEVGSTVTTILKASDGYSFGSEHAATKTVTTTMPGACTASPDYTYVTINTTHCTANMATGWYALGAQFQVTFTASNRYAYESSGNVGTETKTTMLTAPTTFGSSPQYGYLTISATRCTTPTTAGWYSITSPVSVTFTASTTTINGVTYCYAFDTEGTATYSPSGTVPCTLTGSADYGEVIYNLSRCSVDHEIKGDSEFMGIGSNAITINAWDGCAFLKDGSYVTTLTGNYTVPCTVTAAANYGKLTLNLTRCSAATESGTAVSTNWYEIGSFNKIKITAITSHAFDTEGTTVQTRSITIPGTYEANAAYAYVTYNLSNCEVTSGSSEGEDGWEYIGAGYSKSITVQSTASGYRFEGGSLTKVINYTPPCNVSANPNYLEYTMSLTKCSRSSGHAPGWYQVGTELSTTVTVLSTLASEYAFSSSGGQSKTYTTTLTATYQLKAYPTHGYLAVTSEHCDTSIAGWYSGIGEDGTGTIGRVILTADNNYAFTSTGTKTKTFTNVAIPTTISTSPTYGYVSVSCTHCTAKIDSVSITSGSGKWYLLTASPKTVNFIAESGYAFTQAGATTLDESVTVPGSTTKGNAAWAKLTIVPTNCSVTSGSDDGYYAAGTTQSTTFTVTSNDYAFDSTGAQKTLTKDTVVPGICTPVANYGKLTLNLTHCTADSYTTGWYTVRTEEVQFTAEDGYAFGTTSSASTTKKLNVTIPGTVNLSVTLAKLTLSMTNCTANITSPCWCTLSTSKSVTYTVTDSNTYAFNGSGGSTYTVAYPMTEKTTATVSPTYGKVNFSLIDCVQSGSSLVSGNWYSVGGLLSLKTAADTGYYWYTTSAQTTHTDTFNAPKTLAVKPTHAVIGGSWKFASGAVYNGTTLVKNIYSDTSYILNRSYTVKLTSTTNHAYTATGTNTYSVSCSTAGTSKAWTPQYVYCTIGGTNCTWSQDTGWFKNGVIVTWTGEEVPETESEYNEYLYSENTYLTSTSGLSQTSGTVGLSCAGKDLSKTFNLYCKTAITKPTNATVTIGSSSVSSGTYYIKSGTTITATATQPSYTTYNSRSFSNTSRTSTSKTYTAGVNRTVSPGTVYTWHKYQIRARYNSSTIASTAGWAVEGAYVYSGNVYTDGYSSSGYCYTDATCEDGYISTLCNNTYNLIVDTTFATMYIPFTITASGDKEEVDQGEWTDYIYTADITTSTSQSYRIWIWGRTNAGYRTLLVNEATFTGTSYHFGATYQDRDYGYLDVRVSPATTLTGAQEKTISV